MIESNESAVVAFSGRRLRNICRLPVFWDQTGSAVAQRCPDNVCFDTPFLLEVNIEGPYGNAEGAYASSGEACVINSR
jgi:hypothetical protein